MSDIGLRPWTRGDMNTLNAWVTDEALLRQFAGPGLRRPLTFEQLVAPADDTCAAFAVTDESGRLIGHAQLRGIDRNRRSCRLARVLIGDPALRGRGLGGMLIRALIDHASNSLAVAEITLNVYPENTAAVRCYERCGFEFTGRPASVADAGEEMRYVLP